MLRKPKLFILFVVGLICVGMLFLSVHRSKSKLFRQHVLDPIPQSVAEIKVDHARRIFGYGYVFRFKISRAGVTAIINSRPFKRVQNATYEDWGELRFDWSPTSGSGLALYPPGTQKPSWFTLNLWRDPEAYVYEERGEHLTTHMLLYNRQLAEGYFLAFMGDYAKQPEAH